MDYQEILFTAKGPVGYLTLNNAGKVNALSVQMIKEIIDLLQNVSSDESLKVIVLKAAQSFLLKPKGLPHLGYALAQEIYIAGPLEIIPAGEDIGWIVQCLPCVVDGEKGIDLKIHIALTRRKVDPDAFNGSFPFRVFVHGDHRVGRAARTFIFRVTGIEIKIDPATRAVVFVAGTFPFNVGQNPDRCRF